MRKLSSDRFTEKAKKVHGDKYDYSKVDYLNGRTEVEIVCREQHFKAGAKLGGRHITTSNELEEIQYRDGIKTQWVKNNNIKLIRINYKDDIVSVLQKELL